MKKYLLLLIFFLLFGCGRKTPPLPIEKSIPQDPQLEIEVTTLGFNLWITLPAETKGGYPLNKIRALIIERQESPLFSPAQPKIKTFKKKPKLHSAGRLFLFTDTDLKADHIYLYRLRIEKDFLVKTPFLEEKRVCWTYPPSIPTNIKISLSEENLLLTWNPPLQNLKGEPLRGPVYYRIEKIQGERVDTFETTENFYRDVISQIKTCYRLQALLNFHQTIIPGPKSDLYCYP